MEDDLIFGTTNLPEPGKEEAPGRITQGAAWHMLSECYLNQGKFQLAADAATEVIEGYSYALMTTRFGDRQNVVFGQGDPYYDLFAFGNQTLGTNKEAIWVIQVEPPQLSEAGQLKVTGHSDLHISGSVILPMENQRSGVSL